jgi:predicted RND superfamily exporter protein
MLTAMVLINALFCQQMSLALVTYTGSQMDSVMLMVPSLVFVLTVSAGVHLINYYRDAVAEHGMEGAPLRAVKYAFSPCVLAATTSAVGLGSLTISFLIPIKKFGFYAALGLMLSTCVLFILLPSQLEQISPSRKRDAKAEAGKKRGTKSSRWDRLFQGVRFTRYWILAVTVVLLAISFWGVSQIRASARVHDLFSPDATILRDYDWLEDRIGPLVPVEIVVRIPKRNAASMIDRLRFLDTVHDTVAKVQRVGAIVSPMTFSPRMPRPGGGARQISREVVLNKKLQKNRDALVEVGLLRETDSEELWRISARAYAGERPDYSLLLAELEKAVEPTLASAIDYDLSGVTAVYCGGIPLVHKAQAQMLRDLINSFVLAFGLIAVMMIVLMLLFSTGEFMATSSANGWIALASQRVLAGLVAMVPNVLPCALVLGGMGLAGIPLEIGSVMTASVALGIAVDDTLHFITWFRRGLINGQTRGDAVRFAYARCGTAMTQTSLICGLGLLAYSISPFVPMARFSWLMFAMLFAALLADLVVLPVTLLSPIGLVFESRRGEHSPKLESVAAIPS